MAFGGQQIAVPIFATLYEDERPVWVIRDVSR
jgi:hypothetical protein